MTSISASSSIYYDSSLELLNNQEQNNRFKNAYVPKTSKWGDKPVCDSNYDDYDSETTTCCSSGYDVSGTIEIAYENDLQDHPGIKALEKSDTCVDPGELEILLDELATYPSNNDSEQNSFSLEECKSLVSNMLSHHYGKLKEIKQKISLGEKYEEVRDFCVNKVIDYVNPTDIFTNNMD